MLQLGTSKMLPNTKCLGKAVDFVYKKCFSSTGNTENGGYMTLDGDITKKVMKLSCLGDDLSSGEGVQEAVPARIRSDRKV